MDSRWHVPFQDATKPSLQTLQNNVTFSGIADMHWGYFCSNSRYSYLGTSGVQDAAGTQVQYTLDLKPAVRELFIAKTQTGWEARCPSLVPKD